MWGGHKRDIENQLEDTCTESYLDNAIVMIGLII